MYFCVCLQITFPGGLHFWKHFLAFKGGVPAKSCFRKREREENNQTLTPKRRKSQEVYLSPTSVLWGKNPRSLKGREHLTVTIWKLFKKQTTNSQVKEHLGVKRAGGITQPLKKQRKTQAHKNQQRCFFLTEVWDSGGLRFYLISSRIGGKKE